MSSDRPLWIAMNVLPVHAALVVARPYPGFGPRELAYTVDLALRLAPAWAAEREVAARRAGLSRSKRSSALDLRTERTDLHALVARFAPHGSPLHAQLTAADRHHGKRLRDLAVGVTAVASVAQGLIRRGARDRALAELLADRGLTEVRIARASEGAKRFTTAQQKHATARATEKKTYDALNELDGRLATQLEALGAAALRARRERTDVPALDLALIEPHLRHDRQRTAPAPGASSTPAGAPDASTSASR
jgi:hypothetical protein